MELILIRHARPVREERAAGLVADPGLSGEGLEQARAVARWLGRSPPTRLISSPALRARETAAPCVEAFGLDLAIDDRLRDSNADPSRYVPMEEERRVDPAAFRRRLEAYRERPAAGAVAERVHASLEDWIRRSAGERIAVFCHGSVVNLFASRLLGLGRPFFLEADYASAHRFMISRDGVGSVRSLNETAYL